MDITGFSAIYQGDQNGWTWSNYYIIENLLWTKASHNFRFGFDKDSFNGRHTRLRQQRCLAGTPLTGRFSGPLRRLPAGYMDTSSRSTSVGASIRSRNNWGDVTFTDDYKITPR